jgi:hypothetical protein
MGVKLVSEIEYWKPGALLVRAQDRHDGLSLFWVLGVETSDKGAPGRHNASGIIVHCQSDTADRIDGGVQDSFSLDNFFEAAG